jgi:hypothetical protein
VPTTKGSLSAFELKAEQWVLVAKELNTDLDPAWSVDHLGVVAFIQDAASFRIDRAAAQYPIVKN